MKILKPIRDFNSYSKPIAQAIFTQLDEMIYAPLAKIIKPLEKNNALANEQPNLIYQGIKIHIENPRGTYREGKSWRQLMHDDYGYICGTHAVDGDEMDCFVGQNPRSKSMFVVTQKIPGTFVFDEYKVMFGFNDIREAEKAYFSNYQPGWDGFLTILEYPISYFLKWYQGTLMKELMNAGITPLEDALRRGIMEYRDGYFVGPLKASITKELRGYGAVFNHTRKVYYLDMNRLPQNILQAIAQGKQSGEAIITKVNQYLRAIEGREVKTPNIEPFFSETLDKLSKQFYVTTRAVTSADLEIPLNPRFEEQIKEAYTLNLDKYIKGWYDEAILRLRQKVSDNVQEGYRASNLIEIIKSERGVSQRKATFLAKQETSLMTASYREIRYKDIGVNQYVWSTSHDERVRPDHRILNGKIFNFDHPPVTNQKTGAKNNPGEDYNCRCVAIPYLSQGVNFINPQLMESTNAK